MTLSPDFGRRIADVHGRRGVRWLSRLPGILAECADRWSLTVLPPFEPLSYNYVAPAIRGDGSEVVLKVGVPGPLLRCEIAALRHFAGHGCARLLAADARRGVFLLERLRPGTPLVDPSAGSGRWLADDERVTTIAAGVMRQLWRPVAGKPRGSQTQTCRVSLFPTVADWAEAFTRLRARYEGGTGPLPGPFVARAERLSAELIASQAEQVVLHGDLHHWNIVAAERQPWLALDPQGVVGEPAYEVGALLRNPYPQIATWPDARRVQARRIAQLAEELGFDRARIAGWGFAQAVLSACWDLEDHGTGWEPWIAVAETLVAFT
jgi:streptomycin 6-kinase